ncbi:hypothetical protein FRB95_009408 [Tulasnella sp. JGI-2019a]|nr:hypothetical protein FRB95_009408 [Tulasnella sp. JGI-2019a]
MDRKCSQVVARLRVAKSASDGVSGTGGPPPPAKIFRSGVIFSRFHSWIQFGSAVRADLKSLAVTVASPDRWMISQNNRDARISVTDGANEY